MSPPEAEKLFRGRWRIVETSTWDRDALDDVAPAHITFGARHAGELAMIAIEATLDYRVRQLGGESLVEFTWSGFDDGTEVSGRGWGVSRATHSSAKSSSTWATRRPLSPGERGEL